MAKKLGDRLLSSVTRGGWKDVEVTIDRGSGDVTESLWPSSNGQFRETPVYEQGLDGRVDVKYYTYELLLEYHQCDGETLADLYSSALESQWHTTGVDVTLTFMNSEEATLTMYMVPELHNDGYGSYLGVTLRFSATALTPMYQA